ncbi:hypothetical protein SAMN05216464_101638 [Mucilaginibacter pineti]|uniref:Uncharacterized protein n=1 Tax=Mucilaginibacter pineti TaxID=1391627 RepID=A0A1G6UID1_9SPHI|nr:hypothetical protein [Mucilaginibacter pineti]SDD40295.1 hypothetical protein SAMN05216464_101638 [Mucilaginibacter pineti]
MKTSNKLLIIFFTCIPLSLLAYNTLLKQSYQAGNFVSEFYPDINSNYEEKNLPAFKHIVIDGLVKSPNARTEQGQMPTVSIGNASTYPKSESTQNRIGIITQYADVLRTTVKNDTLFVSLFTKAKDAYITTGDKALLQIKATDVTSVSISYAYATITDKPSAADSLKLTVIYNGIYNVNNLYINNLSVYGSGMAQTYIYGNNKIQNFNYSLLAESLLHIDGHPIQHYRAIKVDEKASIEIKDKAANMQKELQ